MNRISITKVNGKWFVNGKTLDKVNDEEKKFFNDFIIVMKLDYKATEQQKFNQN